MQRGSARRSPRARDEVRRLKALIPPPPDRQFTDQELQWLLRLVRILGASLESVTPDVIPSQAELQVLVSKLVEYRQRVPRYETK